MIGKILSQEQAKTIYEAMRTLNNIGMKRFKTLVQGFVKKRVTVEYCDATSGLFGEGVFVRAKDNSGIITEKYPNQAAFAAAYNLN